MSFDGTYKETYKDVTQEWDTEADISAFGLNLGYGHVDSLSGDVYLVIDYNAVKFGSNLRYGFDIFENNFSPHLLLGNGVVFTGKTSLSNNPNVAQGYPSSYNSPFVQLGVGASYAFSDTVEFYADVLLIIGFEDGSSKYKYYERDSATGTTTYYSRIEDNKWNTTSIGFQLDVKFHAFGSSAIRRKYLKEEALELEEERQKNIDSIFDD